MPTSLRTLADFDREVLHNELPVIVDVWSPTCAPCQKLAPVLIDVATRYQNRIAVVEVSTEAEPQLLARLAVRATPTLVLYANGHELGRTAGFRPGEWFDEMIAAEFPER